MSRWAAIVAGGSGTRFWPLSRADRPKQFLPLDGSRPLLRATFDRLRGLFPPERVLVVTARALVDRTRDLLTSLPPENVLGEPRAASTAPALAWATAVARARDDQASILSLHADWHVGDDGAFRATCARALDVAERFDMLVTVGVAPTRPEIGYGYVVPGEPIEGDVARVAQFIEKPDAARARELVASGALWNSGLFAWTAARFFAETDAHAPEIAPYVPMLTGGAEDEFFAAVTPIAIDVSHFERTRRAAVVPGTYDWDDVGTWAALARVRQLDDTGNVRVGDIVARDVRDCVLWAEEGVVIADGVRDLVVVRSGHITLITTRDRAAHLKTLLETIPDELRESL